MKRILLLTGIALAALAGLPMQAAATPITATIDLSTVFTGSTPDGSGPWLSAQFTSIAGSKTGTLVLTSHLSGPDFLQGLSSTKSTVGWAFYLSQTLSGLTCASGSCAGNNALYKASGLNTGPVPGVFNLGFGWSPGDRFFAGDVATYDLTFSHALTGNPFVDNGSGWSSVAHVQGIAPGGCSGWIVAGDGTGAQGSTPCPGRSREFVPEPDELGVFGFGLLFAGLCLGLRRRYN